MSALTTHVLDTSSGRPAAEVGVRLERREGGAWALLSEKRTDADGRVRDLLDRVQPGVYRLTFDTGGYFRRRGLTTFFPEAAVTFEVRDAAHHHVPLLLSPFGFSTYRGS
jgi:5-hydroxyisourate hydrolase